MAGCASKEVEFRDFATLTKPDIVALQAEITKAKPGRVKLHSGQTAHCTAKICYVNWVARNVSLHVEDESKATLAIPKGNFTLEKEELDDLSARMTAAAEAGEEILGRVGNLGHLCSATECKLSVFVPAPHEDAAKAAHGVRKSTNRGEVFRNSANE